MMEIDEGNCAYIIYTIRGDYHAFSESALSNLPPLRNKLRDYNTDYRTTYIGLVDEKGKISRYSFETGTVGVLGLCFTFGLFTGFATPVLTGNQSVKHSNFDDRIIIPISRSEYDIILHRMQNNGPVSSPVFRACGGLAIHFGKSIGLPLPNGSGTRDIVQILKSLKKAQIESPDQLDPRLAAAEITLLEDRIPS